MTDTTSWWFSRYGEIEPARGRAVAAEWSLAAGTLKSYSPRLMDFNKTCTCPALCFLFFEPSVNPYEETMRQLLTHRTVVSKGIARALFYLHFQVQGISDISDGRRGRKSSRRLEAGSIEECYHWLARWLIFS